MKSSPKIIFEDNNLLVIDKPAGVVVNRAETTTKVETIQDWAEERIGEFGEVGEFRDRGGIVHRLDKDTSGILIIAKTSEAFENLKNQFKNRTTVKKYLALVHGKVEPAQGAINAPIERNPFNRKHFGVFPGGREAVTQYQTYRTYKSYTLLEVTPKTGRTHQIRVHLKYINYPVVADPIYGGRKNSQQDSKWCPRLFLHATQLQIKHPQTGKLMNFQSSLPSELATVLNLIRGD